MLQLDLQSRLPLYEQIKRQISQQILDGTLKPDDQLPSIRQVARKTGINPNTVQKAYQGLEQDGLIYSVPSRGSYVSADTLGVEQLQKETKEALKKAVVTAHRASISKGKVLDVVNQVYKEDFHD